MRDPISWSVPLGQLFGITIRAHVLLPMVMVGLILRFASAKEYEGTGIWLDVSLLMGLLFISVLLHELGHCFAARSVEGDAREILLWPLGGLAYVDVPNTPKAHLLTALGGPLVNFGLAGLAALLLAFATEGYWPPFSFYFPTRLSLFSHWGGADPSYPGWWSLALGQLFWINGFLGLMNVVLVAWPLDGARILQAILWSRTNYRSSMMMSIRIGFMFVFVVLLVAIIQEWVLAVLLAYIVYMGCKQEYIALESGGEESLFGYDFSQGYTSLEKDAPHAIETKKKKQGFLQCWLQKRRLAKMQREKEQQEAEERRMDELLEKINSFGKASLTDEENRFLKRVADRYKNRS